MENTEKPNGDLSDLNVGLDVFTDLYDSEINFVLYTFWDGGYSVKLGDEMNGFKGESLGLKSIQDAVSEITNMAIKHFPNSSFSKKYAYNVELTRRCMAQNDEPATNGRVE